jgi:hypothetical protein
MRETLEPLANTCGRSRSTVGNEIRKNSKVGFHNGLEGEPAEDARVSDTTITDVRLCEMAARLAGLNNNVHCSAGLTVVDPQAARRIMPCNWAESYQSANSAPSQFPPRIVPAILDSFMSVASQTMLRGVVRRHTVLTATRTSLPEPMNDRIYQP